MTAVDGDSDVVKVLIEGGADVNASDWMGDTTLMVAKQRRKDNALRPEDYNKIAEILKKWGAKDLFPGLKARAIDDNTYTLHIITFLERCPGMAVTKPGRQTSQA